MTDQQLAERIAKLETVNAAEIGCRAGELLGILRQLQRARVALNPKRAALASVGIPYPPPKGWKKRLLAVDNHS